MGPKRGNSKFAKGRVGAPLPLRRAGVGRVAIETREKEEESGKRVKEATDRLEKEKEKIRSLDRTWGEMEHNLEWDALYNTAAEIRSRTRGLTGLEQDWALRFAQKLRDRISRKRAEEDLREVEKVDKELAWFCSDTWTREGATWRLFGAEYSSDEAADGPSSVNGDEHGEGLLEAKERRRKVAEIVRAELSGRL